MNMHFKIADATARHVLAAASKNLGGRLRHDKSTRPVRA